VTVKPLKLHNKMLHRIIFDISRELYAQLYCISS